MCWGCALIAVFAFYIFNVGVWGLERRGRSNSLCLFFCFWLGGEGEGGGLRFVLFSRYGGQVLRGLRGGGGRGAIV